MEQREQVIELVPAVQTILSQLMQSQGLDTFLVTSALVERGGRPVEVCYLPRRQVWQARLLPPPCHLRLVEDQ